MADWWRSWHGAPTDPKWLVISRMTGSTPITVYGVFAALCDHASQADDRGCIDRFDAESFAAFAGVETDEVNGIVAALAAKGLIADGRLAAWERRQPKKEDPNSTDRVRDYRARKQAEKATPTEVEPSGPALPGEGNAMKRDETPRNERVEEKRGETETDTTAPQPPTPRPAPQSAPPRRAAEAPGVLLRQIDDVLPDVIRDFRAVDAQLHRGWLSGALTSAEVELDGGAAELDAEDTREALTTAFQAVQHAMTTATPEFPVRHPQRLATAKVLEAFAVRLADKRDRRERPSADEPRPVPIRPVREMPEGMRGFGRRPPAAMAGGAPR